MPSTQNYYGPPIRKVPTEGHIRRATEPTPCPSTPTRAEAEVYWHLRMRLPPASSHTAFFPLGSSTCVAVRSGRGFEDRRAHGVAMSLAQSGYGIANADARGLGGWIRPEGRVKIELYCQFPGMRSPIWQQAPSPIKIVREDGAAYTLGELVSAVATMYRRFLRTGAAHPNNGAIPRANGTAFRFEHLRLVALHLGQGQWEGWCIPEVVLVDRDPPA